MKTFAIQHSCRFYPEIPQTVRILATSEYNALATFKTTYNSLNDRCVDRLKELKKS